MNSPRPRQQIATEKGGKADVISIEKVAEVHRLFYVEHMTEAGSIVMTTNMAFKDWDKVFPGAACLTAMIDRLTHHCDIVTIQRKSFRHKESAERNASRKSS